MADSKRSRSGSSSKGWRRVFWLYLLSYASLFLIPLVVFGLLFYRDVSQLLQQEVIRNETIALRRTQTALDSVFRSVKDIVVRIGTNPNLHPLLIRQNAYQAQQAQQILRDYTASQPAIYDILIEYDAGKLLGSASTYSLPLYFDDIMGFQQLSEDRYNELAKKSMTPQFLAATGFSSPGTIASRYVVCIAPVPRGSQAPFATTIVLVSTYTLEGLIAPIGRGDATGFYIIGEDGQDVLSGVQAPGEVRESDNVETVQIDGTEYLSVGSASSELPWRYVRIIPTAVAASQAEAASLRTILIVTTLSIVGFALILLYMRWTYGPLEHLKRQVESASGTETRPIDGFAGLESAIRRVVTSNAELSQVAQTSRELRIRQVLLETLQGRITSRDRLLSMGRGVGIPIEAGFVTVLLARLRGRDPSKQRWRGDAIDVALGSLGREQAIAFHTRLATLDPSLVLVVCMHRTIDAISEDLLSGLAAEIERRSGYSCVVACGDSYSDPLLLPKSFAEAHAALEATFVRAGAKVVRYATVSRDRLSDHWYDDRAVVEQLKIAIRQGNPDGFSSVLADVATAVRRATLSPTSARLVCYDLLNTCAKTVEEGDYALPADTTAFLIDVLNAGTLEEFLGGLRESVIPILERIRAAKESGRHDLARAVLEHVREHCCEVLFSVDTVADAFAMSSAYISRFFKDQFGVPLSEYVAALRVERFKELLRTSDAEVKTLVRQVGYQSVPSFVRKFKESEGITPSQYKASFHGQ